MFNFRKQAAFEAKLAQVYDQLSPEFKAEVALPDFLLEFLVIEVNGKALMPDKPGDNADFMLTDNDFEQVVTAFKSVYELQ
jgi:hypothetical protein